MRVFVSGGCKNGKSYYAQRLTAAMGAPRYYIATMVSADAEDDERIARHRAERDGLGFETLELPRDVDRLPDLCDVKGAYLLDSATALLANEMFRGADYHPDAHEKVALDILALINQTLNVVVVSDYIYSDAFIYDEMTENYRMGLGYIDRIIAAACDVVVEITLGNATIHKSADGFGELHEKII